MLPRVNRLKLLSSRWWASSVASPPSCGRQTWEGGSVASVGER
jgi:hypothetical protein